MRLWIRFAPVSILTLTLIAGLSARAQEKSESPEQAKESASAPAAKETASVPAAKQEVVDPLKRTISKEEQKKRDKALKQELGKAYKTWLNEDVRWIITDEELAAFKQLSNDEERDQFIEGFWGRRDPTPDTIENEYKEEHYRRIAYANEHFAAGIPGWKTDRGRIYVVYGAPDEIESHPTGGQYYRDFSEGGGATTTYPFEKWRYRYIEDVGQEIILEFVDKCQCSEYKMTMDENEKDALLYIPGAGLTQWEEMGMASKGDRVAGLGGFGRLGGLDKSKQFDKLDLLAKISRAPAVKFKDLQSIVDTKIRYNLMPFDVRADFVKITSDTVLVPVTVQIKNKDVTFTEQEGVQRGVVNIFGRVSTLTGKIAQTFEDTVRVDVPSELLPKTVENVSVYWKSLPLRPGRYRMDIVVKDVNGDRVGTWSKSILVPEFTEDQLASSSLIVADVMERVAAKDVGTGNFVIGTTKVRPRVESSDGKPAIFKRGQKMNLWMQVYNLSMDEQTKRPSATIEYNIVNIATNKPVVHAVEDTGKLGNVGEQVTIEKSLPTQSLEPGVYSVTIKVDDKVSKQTISPTAKFAVE
jgi:GWxTD domain-containing protein